MPETYSILKQMNALTPERLYAFFGEFFTRVLPRDCLLRMMDCYLLEGRKILFRYGLAIIKTHKRAIKTKKFANADAFWEFIFAQRDSDVYEVVNVHKIAFDSERNYVEKVYRPLGISRESITSLHRSIKSVSSVMKSDGSGGERTQSSDARAARAYDDRMFADSSMLTEDMSRFLQQSCIPEKDLVNGFALCFNCLRDGYELTSLYEMVRGLSPCLVIAETLPLHSNGDAAAVIGFFVTAAMSPPSAEVRGDGATTMCFRLDRGADGKSQQCYRWAWRSADGGGRAVSDFTMNQFVVCSQSCLSIGASESLATNAIRFDRTLQSCSCGETDTFANPSLVGAAESGGIVGIRNVEVFCGLPSVEKAMRFGTHLQLGGSAQRSK